MKSGTSDTARGLRHLIMADSYLPHSGGSRVYYANLIKNLLQAFPDSVTLLTKKVPGWKEYDRTVASDRLRIIRRFKPLPNWRYEQLPKAIPQFLHAFGTLLTKRFDVLHCGDLFPQAFNGVFLSKIFRVPLLMYCHGDEISQTDRRRYQPKVRNFIYRHADVIIAANQFAYDGLVRIGTPSSRLHKLTPGVDSETFHPRPCNTELTERFGLSGSKILLTVARLVPRKNVRIVIEALPAVLEQVPNLKYLIAGEGPEEGNLRKRVQELHLDNAVQFLGNIPNSQIGEFYNLCDVFIMANRLEAGGDVESFGMVFLEANALGKPVIGGRSGGAAEAIVDGVTGFLVNPDDPRAVADRLLKLLKNEDLAKKMGTSGLERVRNDFNWRSRAADLRQICRELV